MQKKEVKKVLVCIVSIVMLALTITTSFATDTANKLNALRPGNNEIVTTDNNMNYSSITDAANKISEATNNAIGKLNDVKNEITDNKVVNNAVNNSQGLPYTGSQYTGILVIAVCIIVAVYSYIKVKKYNV